MVFSLAKFGGRPVLPALINLGQEDCEFKASLGCTVRAVQKKDKETAQNTFFF